jgi:hypothetical protein
MGDRRWELICPSGVISILIRKSLCPVGGSVCPVALKRSRVFGINAEDAESTENAEKKQQRLAGKGFEHYEKKQIPRFARNDKLLGCFCCWVVLAQMLILCRWMGSANIVF